MKPFQIRKYWPYLKSWASESGRAVLNRCGGGAAHRSRRLNDLAWLALNIKGSAAVIEVRERIPAPQVENDTTPRNILASQMARSSA